MNHNKISEYIDNLQFKKKVTGGVDSAQVYEAIRELSSMYNELLSEAYAENEQLKKQLENMSVMQAFDEADEESDAEENVILAVAQQGDISLDKQTKELRKLKRKDLLEIMLEQSRKNEDQRLLMEVQKKKILHLEQKLQERKIDIAQAGTLAEASLKLNGVFEAAQAAAQQYLDNLATADNRCAAMEQAARERCEELEEQTSKVCRTIEEETRLKCERREQEAEERCQEMNRKAKEAVDRHWEELSEKLEVFYNTHKGLKELLSSSGEIQR